MPLEKSSSKKAFVRNLKTEIHAGKPQDQALAIAYSIKRKARKHGGKVHVGPIMGPTGGRADKRPMEVPNGAYVLTADHVSGLGEGNTHAGMAKLDKMFPKSAKAHAEAPKEIKRAAGGKVPIYAADGEYVIHPDDITDRYGDLDHGHKVLDAWQKHERQQLIHTLSNLEPPAQD